MAYLVDTNLLLRSVEPHHPMYGDAVNAISALGSAGVDLVQQKILILTAIPPGIRLDIETREIEEAIRCKLFTMRQWQEQ